METVRLFCGIQIRLLPQPFIDVFIEILFPHYIHYIEFQLPEGNQFHPHVIYFIMRLSRLQQGAERFLIAAVRQQAGSIPPSSLNVQRMNIVGHFRHPYPSQSGTGLVHMSQFMGRPPASRSREFLQIQYIRLGTYMIAHVVVSGIHIACIIVYGKEVGMVLIALIIFGQSHKLLLQTHQFVIFVNQCQSVGRIFPESFGFKSQRRISTYHVEMFINSLVQQPLPVSLCVFAAVEITVDGARRNIYLDGLFTPRRSIIHDIYKSRNCSFLLVDTFG